MKKIILFSAVIVGFMACKKETTDSASSSGSTNTFSYKVDGVAGSVDVASGRLDNQGHLGLQGGPSGSGNFNMEISLIAVSSAGTYALSGYDFDLLYFIGSTPYTSDNFGKPQGQIVITKHDISAKHIEGTFSGKVAAYNDTLHYKNITEGKLSITYQ